MLGFKLCPEPQGRKASRHSPISSTWALPKLALGSCDFKHFNALISSFLGCRKDYPSQ